MNNKHNDSKSIRLDAVSFGLVVLPSKQRVLCAIERAGVRSESVVRRNREGLANPCDVPDYSEIVVAVLVVLNHEHLAQRASLVLDLAVGNPVIVVPPSHATAAATTKSRRSVIGGQHNEDCVTCGLE